MTNNNPFRLHFVINFILCSYAGGSSLCKIVASDFEEPKFESLCDLDFCTCRDPFGRVRCVCPAENPNEELILTSKGSCSVPPDTTSISLENCRKVSVVEEALVGVRSLRNVEFVNITEISLQGRLFNSEGPRRIVNFRNSTVLDIPSFTFSGNTDSVIFEGCTIRTVRAFAFSNIKWADRIIFRDTNVIAVESQAFKKFTMNKFLMIGSRFNTIPSRFVVDVEVENVFKIESTYVDLIRTLGFKIYNPKKVLVINSVINRIQEEAFKIVTKGEVLIENNVMSAIDNEAFRGISVDKYVLLQNGKQKFKFQNQTVTMLEDKSLYVNRSAFEVQIGRLMIDEVCTCDGLALWRDITTTGKEISQPIDIELEPIMCRLDGNRESSSSNYDLGREFYTYHCTKLTSSIYFFVLIITATAIFVLVLIILTWCIIKRRRNKWRYVPSSVQEQPPKTRMNNVDKKKGRKKQSDQGKAGATKSIIVPDGRTYKETEFHIIVEKAEPLNDDCMPCPVVRDPSESHINPQSK